MDFTVIYTLVLGTFACVALGDTVREKLDGHIAKDVLQRLGNLENFVKHQDERIKELETIVKTQHSLLLKQNTELSEIKKRKSIGIRTTTTTTQHVAFSSYLDHRQRHTLIDQIIKFDKLLLNDGNCYNTVTGVFSAPVSGTYLFTYTVNTFVSSYQLMVKLVVDGVNQSDAVSDPFHQFQEIQGGATVILHVNAGQSVWIAPYNTANVTVDGRPNDRFSTFSGVLLYQ